MLDLHFQGIVEWATPTRLDVVRLLRLRYECSLRAIADRMHEPDAPWTPSWNQLAGEDLCRLAGVDHG